MAEPAKLHAGDSATWQRQESEFTPAAGWSLTYYLVRHGLTEPVVVTTTGSGGTYTATLAASATAELTPGIYRWTATVTRGDERHVLEQGTLEILPDPTQQYDTRTHAEYCLAAVTAALEKRVGDPMLEYEIDGIKASKIPHADLVRLRAVYADKVRRERGGSFFRSYRV